MKPPKKRQKLCQNCDGEVDLEVIFCPYCGSDLLEGKAKASSLGEFSERDTSSEKQGQKLYPPPYSSNKIQVLETEPEEEPSVLDKTEEPAKIPKNTFWAMLLFNLGVQSLLLGILLFVFSEKGAVHLHFDAKVWLFYVVFSMPMLYFGWKAVSQLDE